MMVLRTIMTALCLAFFPLGTVSVVFGQAVETKKKQVTLASDEVKVFSLENLDPDDAVRILSQVFGVYSNNAATATSMRLGADQRSKRVIAKGDAETLKMVEALLLLLDEKANRQVEIKSQIFRLANSSPDAVQSAIVSTGSELMVHSDKRTNSVVVTAPAERIQRITELVKLLDRPMDVDDVSIRIVWLVEASLAKKGADAVPEDLSGPIDALRKKVGLGELRTAAQTIVRCTPNECSQFAASGTSTLSDPASFEYEFEFLGRVNKDDRGKYRLYIQGHTKRNGSETPTSRLTTDCSSLGMGQPVIVGTTAIDSRASVFVVQILEK